MVGHDIDGAGSRTVLTEWLDTPVPGARLRDEFFMKFAVATSARLATPSTLIDRQRREYLQSIRDLDGRLAPSSTPSTPS